MCLYFYLNLKLLIIGESISSNQLPFFYICTVYKTSSNTQSHLFVIFSKLKYRGPGAIYCSHTQCNTLPSLFFYLSMHDTPRRLCTEVEWRQRRCTTPPEQENLHTYDWPILSTVLSGCCFRHLKS